MACQFPFKQFDFLSCWIFDFFELSPEAAIFPFGRSSLWPHVVLAIDLQPCVMLLPFFLSINEAHLPIRTSPSSLS